MNLYPLLFLSFLISAEGSETLKANLISPPPEHFETTVDDFQNYISKKVLIFSSNLDRFFAESFEDENSSSAVQKIGYDESNSTDELFSKPKFKKEENKETYETATWFDEFFKDETYLDSTNKSYVRVRAGYVYDWRGDPFLHHNISARIKLPRTKEKIQLYFSDDKEEHFAPFDAARKSGGEGIGVKFFLPSIYGRLFSNASAGISGIDNPYLRTHMEYPIFLDDWLLRLSQNFKYSIERKFDEWSDLSLDRTLADKDLIRLFMQRSTNSEIEGMEYLLRLAYRNTLHPEIGTSYYVGFNGRTKDLTTAPYPNALIPQEGVYEYVAGIIWRQQLYKKYLFYQLEPIASFHEQYDYRINYLLRFSVDLYFGYQP